MDGATIFALSSGAPPAAIAIVRISGDRAGAALTALHGRLPEPRRATLGWLRAPADGERLDRALLLWLPGPRTATGDDIAELHLHGGRAVARAVLSALADVPGLRPAAPGEFTRRAFANGRIDLAEAEGLADLIAAETEAQRRQAQLLAGGALSRRVVAWQERILVASAEIEATLDFADEGDVAVDGRAAARAAAAIAHEIGLLLASPAAERLRDGIRVVLAGPPNAGKSTLLNTLVEREAALTAATPGTTRDVIEIPVAIAGIPFLFCDTAGIRRKASGAVERDGIARARSAAGDADILLWLGEAQAAPHHPTRVIVHARSDLPGRDTAPADADIAVSAVTGDGIHGLRDRLCDRAAELLPRESELALADRQRGALADAAAMLVDASHQEDPILAAEGLRQARSALDRLTGRSGAEDMLDALFRRFCIGK